MITKTIIVAFVATMLATKISFAKTDNQIINDIIEYKLDAKQAVGVSVATIENGEISYLTFGALDLEDEQIVTVDTLFEIGSITKTFTSLALANMVQEGKVKLYDPVQKYLPDTVKMPLSNGKEITLLSLANHSSGLPRLPSNMPFSDPEDPYADYSVELIYSFLNAYVLPRDIGEQVEYSNLGAGLLGHILSLIDNKSYEQVINDRVFKSFGMTKSFVEVPSSHLSQLSNGYGVDLKKAKHWRLPTLAGAGAIKSNIIDMAVYLQNNIEAENASIQLTHKQTIGFDNQQEKVGLAWFTAEHQSGKYLWHNGGTGGFRSFMGFDPVNKKGIVILENTTNGMDALGDAYMRGTLAQLKSNLLDVKLIDEAKLVRLNGDYVLAPGFIMSVTNVSQKLFIQATGQAKLPLTAKSETVFVQNAVGAKITFELNDKGEPLALTLEQGGRLNKALKIDVNGVN